MVIDGQGGGIGKSIIAEIKNENIDAEIIAVGVNPYATAAMKKAGADSAATGENAVIINSLNADVIMGPIGIAMANSLKGEISARTADAVTSSDAVRILIPLNKCGTIIVGVSDNTLAQNIKEAVARLKTL